MRWIDPDEINQRSKRDQQVRMERFGGADAVRKAGVFSRSPIPGSQVEIEAISTVGE